MKKLFAKQADTLKVMTYANDIRPIASPIPLSEALEGFRRLIGHCAPIPNCPFLVSVFRRLILKIIGFSLRFLAWSSMVFASSTQPSKQVPPQLSQIVKDPNARVI